MLGFERFQIIVILCPLNVIQPCKKLSKLSHEINKTSMHLTQTLNSRCGLS